MLEKLKDWILGVGLLIMIVIGMIWSSVKGEIDED